MKKRILSLLLVIAMVVVLLPQIALTADAADYASGQTVTIKSLNMGDILRKGSRIIAEGMCGILESSSPTTANGKVILSLYAYQSWTVDRNYYVVKNPHGMLCIYPIPDSPITFYPNGGTLNGSTAAQTFPGIRFTGDYNDVSWLNPSRPGCTFLGWYTSDGKEQVYNAQGKAVNCSLWQNGIYQGEGAKSLIAKWQVNTSVTFRYFPNGGVGQPDNFVTWKATPSSSYPDNHWNYANSGDTYYMTRHGYTATGYYAKADGSCAYHQDDNFTSYADLCDKYGVSTTGEHTIDIYAQWSPNNYTVSFDSDGGSMDTGSKSVTYDSTYGDLPTPTRDGHTFNGWFTAAAGGTQVTNATKVTTASNHTLYARWTEASYTVTWKNHDGTVLETDNGLTYGITPEYNGDTPIKPEDEEFTYTFSGWDPEVGPVSDDAEYTAQFTAKPKHLEPTYTVTIPPTAEVGEDITISATDVVLNEGETLTVTLQSDFKLYMGQDVALPFVINGGSIQNNAVILSITGNGDQTAPQTAESTPLTVTPAEDPPYAGTYTGTITFTVAVNTAENS